MHQLTLALHRQGHGVSGSDDEINDPARTNLRIAGLLPDEYGWFPEKITRELDAVVLGMHAKADNPELKRAQELSIPVYSLPQYVYEAAKDKQRIVVAGSHGKTTITSMIMHALQAAGKDFDYLVGAKVQGFESSVRLSEAAPLMVLEGDEYPASAVEKKPKIFFYHPHISILSGLEWDHVNVFPTREIYLDQFRHYLRMMEVGATLFYNSAESAVCDLVAENAHHLDAQPYAMPSYRYEDGTAIVTTPGGEEVRLSVFGSHNLLNMEGARMVCEELGIEGNAFYQSMTTFAGAARRLEKLTQHGNITAFRDFAHAPSKLRATLAAVHEAFPEHRLIAVYELHTFSSLSEGFLTNYAGTMAPADEAMVYFSRHALELKGLPPLKSADVAQAFQLNAADVKDDKEGLVNAVNAALNTASTQPAILLLMSSGTFDGTDWKEVIESSKR